MKALWKTMPALCLAFVPAVAFAQVDAGTLDVGEPGDATITQDVAQDLAGDATGAFNENPCWDEKCPGETAACQADATCVKIVGCIKTQDQACLDSIDAANPGVGLYNTMAQCGFEACTNPSGASCQGKCGQYLGATSPCNCDPQCSTYGDCCSDFATLCQGSCAGKCGAYDENAVCQCDSECSTYGDCCPDLAQVCGGTCQPNCKNADGSQRTCGSDGCGDVCGVCQAGETCSTGTGKCVPGTAGGDAISGDTTGPDATGDTTTVDTKGLDAASDTLVTDTKTDAVKTDADTKDTKQDTAGSTGSGKSGGGGCSASPLQGDQTGLLLGLLGLAGVVWARRRRVA